MDNILKMPIQEVVELIPQAREVFFRHGLGCFGCHYGYFDSVEGCATFHEVDLDKLMAELSALAVSKEETE